MLLRYLLKSWILLRQSYCWSWNQREVKLLWTDIIISPEWLSIWFCLEFAKLSIKSSLPLCLLQIWIGWATQLDKIFLFSWASSCNYFWNKMYRFILSIFDCCNQSLTRLFHPSTHPPIHSSIQQGILYDCAIIKSKMMYDVFIWFPWI